MKLFSIFYMFFIVFSFIQRISGKVAEAKGEKNNGEIYFKSFYPALFILYIIIFTGSITEYFLINREINLFISFLSLSIYILAIIIRKWAIKSLGNFWSVHIEIKEKHRVIKTGPYRYLRHPNSLCIILEILSLTLIPNAYYTFLFALFVYMPILIIRMSLEDKMLAKKLGEEYIQYHKEVWAIFPFPIGKKRN